MTLNDWLNRCDSADDPWGFIAGVGSVFLLIGTIAGLVAAVIVWPMFVGVPLAAVAVGLMAYSVWRVVRS